MAVNDKLISQTTSHPTPNSTDLVLLEDATTHEFYNTPLSAISAGGGAVTSVAGKTGVVTLDKADVGLSNVDNTSDANKPVSTAQAASIATKQDTLVSGTTIKTVNSTSLLGSGNIVISGGVTNLTTTTAASTVTVNSDTGTDAVIAAATASVAGILTATDKSKLDGIAAGATANSTDAVLLARANHTGSQAQSTITNLVTDLAAKQATLTLTTAGTSGAATLVGATLNIPQYSGGGGTAGITRSISSITTNTTAGAVALTDYTYICTGTLTLTLPTAVGNTNRYSVTSTDGLTTVATTSSQTINGSLTATLPLANMTLEFISNNSNWIVE